ncbi:hypothetical protein DE146DRAFT_755332 [Phaeosphaeria sp. MPI-PUGE-AT-0046c]|nr:hypothetical protein DE146DRAFT_755332 [Phaeosphaeria sp. MPI-PUGE-AT-0046c]
MTLTAIVRASSTPATLSSVRIEDRHPSEFLADLVNSYRLVDNRVILPAQAQRCLVYMLQSFNMFREELHHNPSNSFNYRTSSYNSRQGDYVMAAGGNGPPQSANGSFYHSHTDGSFAATHPNVNLTTYESKPADPVQSDRSRTEQWKKSKPVQEPDHVPLASNSQDGAAALRSINVTDTDTKKPVKLEVASSAFVSPVEQETQAQIKTEEPEQPASITAATMFEGEQRGDCTYDVAAKATAHECAPAELDVALPSNDTVDDSGIVIDDVPACETQLTNNALAARKSTSPSRDSVYGTQSQFHFGGVALFNSEHASDDSSQYDVNANAIDNEKSRKKLVPKTPSYANRRSSRLSTANTGSDTQAAPASSLGKHDRKAFEDIEFEANQVGEPKFKRKKASQG